MRNVWIKSNQEITDNEHYDSNTLELARRVWQNHTEPDRVFTNCGEDDGDRVPEQLFRRILRDRETEPMAMPFGLHNPVVQ